MTPRRVLILYTGGTIGMMESPRGYVPVRGYLRGVLERMPQFHDPGAAVAANWNGLATPRSKLGSNVLYELVELDDPLDSSNMSSGDWLRIAQFIADRYDDWDGFVILHGTDTMAYTASALSFMFSKLRKTVIITGSQIPISQLRSDASENLLGALMIAGHFDIPEVGLYFRNRLFRGNRARKVDAAGFEAFASANYQPLVDVGVDVTVHWERVRVAPEGEFSIIPITSGDVVALRLFPGLADSLLRSVLRPPVRGLVMETYGAGNAPDSRPQFLQVLREATDRGVVIVNVTQCDAGTVTPDYAAGRALLDVGVVPGSDMTPEAALTKLGWLLSQDLSHEEVAVEMARNRRGELTSSTSAADRRFSFHERAFVLKVAAMLAKADPREREAVAGALYPVLLCSAAALGDDAAVKRMLDDGADPTVGDYDGRTAMHLAASEGHLTVVELLLEAGVPRGATDRWGGTPLDDARRHGHDAVVERLQREDSDAPVP